MSLIINKQDYGEKQPRRHNYYYDRTHYYDPVNNNITDELFFIDDNDDDENYLKNSLNKTLESKHHYTFASSTSKNRKHTFLFWSGLIVATAVLIMLLLSFHNNNQNDDTTIDYTEWIKKNPTTTPDCTFEMLRNAFGSNNQKQQQQQQQQQVKCNNDDDANTTCWSLKDELIRIPVSSIINRNDINNDKMGSGKKGVIDKAIFNLQTTTKDSSDINNEQPQYCIAAIKSDKCVSIFTPWTGTMNCVSKYTRRKFRKHSKKSFMNGEYVGALIHYAIQKLTLQNEQKLQPKQQQQQHLIDQEEEEQSSSNNSIDNYSDNDNLLSSSSIDILKKGLIPTWAVIVNDDDHNFLRFPYHNNNPHHLDPSIIAIVMPFVQNLIPFAEFHNNNQNDNMKLKSILINNFHTATDFANVFLSSALSIQFINSIMGIALADIQAKNIGLVVIESNNNNNNNNEKEKYSNIIYSILYDYSLAGAIPRNKFTCQKEYYSCQFCPDPVIPEPFSPGHYLIDNSTDYIVSDFWHYRTELIMFTNMVRKQLLQNEDNNINIDSDSMIQLARAMNKCSNINELVDTLKTFM